jgi:cell wall assembly regulator SMI1
MIEDLFAEIDSCHYAEPCRNPSEIDRLQDKCGYELPEDIKAFYRRYRSVKLFGKADFLYRFVPVSEMHRTRLDICGEDTDEWGPDTWLTVCDVQDNNYIAIDVASKDGEKYNYIDCFHETFAEPGSCTVIAKSFSELLERALHGGQDTVYYLDERFLGYGDALELTPDTAISRIDNPEAPAKGWHVRFWHKGIGYIRFFGDSEYGGMEDAFEAAKRYVEQNILS